MNNTQINQIETIIQLNKKSNIEFPNVNARYMIDFERIYHAMGPILVMVRHDIKDHDNKRTFYLYEREYLGRKEIYEIQSIVVSGIKTDFATKHIPPIQIVR